MAVAAYWAGLAMKDITAGTVILQGRTFGAMLTVGETFNQDTDHFRSDVGNELASATGYTYGGATVTSSTVTYDAATNEVRWDFDDPTWTSSSFSASQMWIYNRRGGTSSADELVMYVEFGGTQTVSSGTFAYVVPATGAGVITVS